MKQSDEASRQNHQTQEREKVISLNQSQLQVKEHEHAVWVIKCICCDFDLYWRDKTNYPAAYYSLMAIVTAPTSLILEAHVSTSEVFISFPSVLWLTGTRYLSVHNLILQSWNLWVRFENILWSLHSHNKVCIRHITNKSTFYRCHRPQHSIFNFFEFSSSVATYTVRLGDKWLHLRFP